MAQPGHGTHQDQESRFRVTAQAKPVVEGVDARVGVGRVVLMPANHRLSRREMDRVPDRPACRLPRCSASMTSPKLSSRCRSRMEASKSRVTPGSPVGPAQPGGSRPRSVRVLAHGPIPVLERFLIVS